MARRPPPRRIELSAFKPIFPYHGLDLSNWAVYGDYQTAMGVVANSKPGPELGSLGLLLRFNRLVFLAGFLLQFGRLGPGERHQIVRVIGGVVGDELTEIFCGLSLAEDFTICGQLPGFDVFPV